MKCRNVAAPGVIFVAVLLGSVADVRAQGATSPAPPAATEDAGAQAVTSAREGVALYEAGKWDDAEKKFAAAEAKLHSPVFVLYIARCQRSTGRWIEARATLRNLGAEKLADDAPPPWKQALADSRAELAALEPTIPSIVIVAAGASLAATVEVDGKPARAHAPVEVDPGSHRVVVREGTREESATVDVRSGERERRVEIAWSKSAAAPASSPSARTGGSVVPGIVVTGLGVAGLGVGAVTGIMALGASDDVQTTCPNSKCPVGVTEADVADDKSRAGTLADVSTISFIAGGVVAAAGLVLIVVRPFGGDEATVTASPGGMTFRGAF